MDTRAVDTYPPRPTSRYDFTVAILCALTLEANAVEALFDASWDDDRTFDELPGDPNTYSTGVIGRHNVVLVHMPGMGKAAAASVASHCKASFPHITLGLVVGICGVVPFRAEEEIILGDVIISEGVVQIDFGRIMPPGFQRKDTLLDNLGRPNAQIRGMLAKLKGLRGREQLNSHIANHLGTLRSNLLLAANYPGKSHDKLFSLRCGHLDGGQTCDQDGCKLLVPRHRLQADQADPQPVVHFGLFASGDSVVKSEEDRDRISRDEGVIAFEMESAGTWDSFPCVAIKGACDYADSNKDKVWQQYAAATAAACMKGLLGYWKPAQGT